MGAEDSFRQLPQQPKIPEILTPEAERLRQIAALGGMLYDAIEGPYMLFSMKNWHEDNRERIRQFVASYIPGGEAPTIAFDAGTADRVCGILRVYLEDTNPPLLQVPNKVFVPFEGDKYTDRARVHKNKSIGSAKEIMSRIEHAKREALLHPEIHPLILIGYRDKRNYGSRYDEEDKDLVLDAGNTDVLLWNPKGRVMAKFKGIKARAIIVDDQTTEYSGLVDFRHINLDCQVLGMTTGAEVGSEELHVIKGLIQTGGEIRANVGTLNVEEIRQTGGINSVPSVTVGEYTQLGGENRASDVIVLRNYHVGKNAKLAARHTQLVGDATFTNDGGEVVSYPDHEASVTNESEPIDDIYEAFGRDLIEYFFPYETENWREMQVLFDAWYNDFTASGSTHEIPSNFLTTYQHILTHQYATRYEGYRSGNYNDLFSTVANIVAFFYLIRPSIPRMNKKSIIDTRDFHQFTHMLEDAQGENVLVVLDKYPQIGSPKKFVVAKHIRTGEATVYKGTADRKGVFMQQIRKISAQTFILNSGVDATEYIEEGGASGMRYKDHVIHISCDNLGVMGYGVIPKEAKIECNDRILQYGNIERVKSLRAKKGEIIKVHMHMAGTNDAELEECQIYEQHGGLFSAGFLRANSFHMVDGIAGGVKIDSRQSARMREIPRDVSHIVAGQVRIEGGICQNLIIDSDDVVIGPNAIIDGVITIRYKKPPLGLKPTIDAQVRNGRVVEEIVG